MVNKKKPSREILETEGYNVSEWIKKAILSGVGAVFMTEEGIRNALHEMNLPKNVISSVLNQAEKTKSDLTGLVVNEFRKFLAGIELDKMIKKALSGQEVEVNVRIRFKGDEEVKKATSKKAIQKKAEPQE